MEIYLDNSATTRCTPRVQEIVKKTMDVDYGNPSSLHLKGVQAEAYVKDATAAIAKTLKVSEKEIVFTSGGTEANNMAIIGVSLAYRRTGMRIVTTQVEHPSVLMSMSFLETLGYEVFYLPVDAQGAVSLDALRDAVNEDTILVSVMHVNNEIGTVQPIEEAAEIIHEKNPQTLFHVDAVQSYGKLPIRPRATGIDMLSVSGHKIHGPKGIGFLYMKEKTKLQPLALGGGQQMGLRSGTHNVPGIAGLGVAAQEAYDELPQKIERLYGLREWFVNELSKLEQVTVNGCLGRGGAPHIVNASFAGVRSEVLLHALEEHGIYVSSGSACSSNKPAPSRTLLSIGLDKELVDAAVRFSFCYSTTQEELELTVQKLKEILPKLRRYSRK